MKLVYQGQAPAAMVMQGSTGGRSLRKGMFCVPNHMACPKAVPAMKLGKMNRFLHVHTIYGEYRLQSSLPYHTGKLGSRSLHLKICMH